MKRPILLIAVLLVQSLHAQGPLLPAELKTIGDFLIGLLSPLVVDQLKQKFSGPTKDKVVADNLRALSQDLKGLKLTRTAFVGSVAEYFDALKKNPDAVETTDSQNVAENRAKEMSTALDHLKQDINRLGGGLQIFTSETQDALDKYFNSKGTVINQLSELRKLNPDQRQKFLDQLTSNGKKFGKAVDDLTDFIASKVDVKETAK